MEPQKVNIPGVGPMLRHVEATEDGFPTRLRYTGSSLSYTLAGILAAATPAAMVALQRQFHASGPVAYVVFLLLATGFAVIVGKTRPVDDADA